MVWVAIGYAGIGSGLTWLVGRPLIRLNTERYAREADLRFALVRVNESAESVALYTGEPDERRNLDEFVEAVLKATRRLSGALARLTWITSGYGWLAIVVPILAAAPDYFSGTPLVRRDDDGGGRLQSGAGGPALLRRQLPEDRRLALGGAAGGDVPAGGPGSRRAIAAENRSIDDRAASARAGSASRTCRSRSATAAS